jgi:hypothetical protein
LPALPFFNFRTEKLSANEKDKVTDNKSMVKLFGQMQFLVKRARLDHHASKNSIQIWPDPELKNN